MSQSASTTAHRTRIKICGVTEPEHVAAVAEAGADLIGFVLHPRSPRALSLDRAMLLAEAAGARGLERVALVVDAGPDLLRAIAEAGLFDRLQYHGSERCDHLLATALPAIKGFPFSSEALASWNACPNAAWILVDGARGGGGEAFDHRVLQPLTPTISKPWLLAGGLTAATVGEAIRTLRPWGVDVSSGVERARGIKDPERIAAFCEAVRAADRPGHFAG